MTVLSIRSVSEPWYRQRWPWLLFAGPAIVVVASFATLMLAAASDDGVIADDYYKRGLLINREIDRTVRADAMHLGAVLRVTPEGVATLAIDGFADASAAPPMVSVHVAHPTRAGQDRTITLVRGPGDVYVGVIAPRPAGRRLVSVEGDLWKLPAAPAADGIAEVRLGAARSVH